jgi:hypothetical protein
MSFLKKYGFEIIKWLVLSVSLLFIVQRIVFHQDVKTIFSKLSSTDYHQWVLLLVVFVLMFLNWGIEAVKWKFAVKNIHEISFKRAFAAVLAGSSVSLFMPNRTGEFAGRIFALPSGKRIQGIFASVAASFSQLIITIICGTIAIITYFILYPENALTEKNISYLIIIPVGLTAILSIVLYFKIGWFTFLFKKWNFLKKYTDKAKVLSEYTTSTLLHFFTLSFFRYLVFLIQFHLLIVFFGIEISFINSILATAMTFYIVTLIPTFTLAEIGVRGSVAVLFFGFYSGAYTEIVAASTLLWLINIVTPGAMGNYFILRFKENP